jgi:2-phospho-L-lactate transferase/gluconeogenesis factor (CofD/UPF0052 family)
VLPSTLHDLRLVAEVRFPGSSEVRVEGESRIPKLQVMQAVWLEQKIHRHILLLIQSILNARLSSLDLEIIYKHPANLLVPDLVEAIRSSRSFKVYVCNVATQKGERRTI